uniref:Uncharacterized protein n=1 Tax=Anguilla anguilla TaxID=7936 RepID=A0A0E9VDU8_ANGAN
MKMKSAYVRHGTGQNTKYSLTPIK